MSAIIHTTMPTPAGRWQFVDGTFGSGVTGAPSLIQSTFGASTGHGNFEAILRQGNRLVHWFKDNSSTANHWVQAQDIATEFNSAGSLIQSTLGTDAGHLGNFEVVVAGECQSAARCPIGEWRYRLQPGSLLPHQRHAGWGVAARPDRQLSRPQ